MAALDEDRQTWRSGRFRGIRVARTGRIEEGATEGDRSRAVDRTLSANRQQNAPEKTSGRTVSCTIRLKLRCTRASAAACGVIQTKAGTDKQGILPWLPTDNQ